MTRIALYFHGKKPALSPASTYGDDGGCCFCFSIKATKDGVDCMNIHPISNGCERWRKKAPTPAKGYKSENEIALIQRNSE